MSKTAFLDRDGTINCEVDFLGNGTWKRYSSIDVEPDRYVHHEFPDAFSAHWIRLIANTGCTATGYFTYT